MEAHPSAERAGSSPAALVPASPIPATRCHRNVSRFLHATSNFDAQLMLHHASSGSRLRAVQVRGANGDIALDDVLAQVPSMRASL